LPAREKAFGDHLTDRMRRPNAIEFVGKTDITIVKSDDPKSFFDQTVDEVHRPVNQLCGIAHDQQYRWMLGLAVIFGFNIDAIGDDLHGLFLTDTKTGSVTESTGVTRTAARSVRAYFSGLAGQ
jgi:hypothetical protein